MKKAHIDENNKIVGWYDSEIHSDIPTPNVEVSDEQWQIAIDNGHNKVNADGTTELDDFRTKEEIVAQRKSDILAQIAAIETKQPRALREVALGMDGAVDRLRAIDDEISALRTQL